MKVITLRGIDDDLSLALKKAAKREGISVNKKILILLQESLGLKKRNRQRVHHDLDHLAGTWSPEDANEFIEKTKSFNQIDQDLWK
jgi:hypothetical protein